MIAIEYILVTQPVNRFTQESVLTTELVDGFERAEKIENILSPAIYIVIFLAILFFIVGMVKKKRNNERSKAKS